mgnify:CR=1 FL=1
MFCRYYTWREEDLDVLIVEKANIVRSGCLAAGVNAINATSLRQSFHRTMLIIVRKMQMEL